MIRKFTLAGIVLFLLSRSDMLNQPMAHMLGTVKDLSGASFRLPM